VRKELANVRSKFATGKGLKSYDRKKYVWKLVYICMLGYEVDFGHVEAVNLAGSENATEKRIGYLSLGVLVGNDDDLARLVVNTVRQDLHSLSEHDQGLALNFCGNVDSRELARSLAEDVLRIVKKESLSPIVRAKAALCVGSFAKRKRDILQDEEVAKALIPYLNESRDLGLALAALGLINSIPDALPDYYGCLLDPLVSLMDRIVLSDSIAKEYMYHGVRCPILQVQALQALRKFKFPTGVQKRTTLVRILQVILYYDEAVGDMHKSNASHAILIEAVNLVISYGANAHPDLLEAAISLLGRFVLLPDSNIRYLALASMARFANVAQREDIHAVLELIRIHKTSVVESLQDSDDSIRKKSLDLLFAMCDVSIAEEIVKKLLDHMENVTYSLKSETVLKIAILAERYAPNKDWYILTTLHLIEKAGNFVSDDVWHRLVQVVTNSDGTHYFAAKAVYTSLQTPHAHDCAIKLGAYLLGEYGYLLVEKQETSPLEVFEAINQHFSEASNEARCLMFHAYAKLEFVYPRALGEEVQLLFDAYRDSSDLELQKRACEYFSMSSMSAEKRSAFFEPMPHFPKERLAAAIQGAKRILNKPGSEKKPGSDIGSSKGGEEEEPEATLLDLSDSGVTPVNEPFLRLAKDQKMEFLKNALLKAKSLLYEDHIVQIGLQHQYSGSKGKMMLFIRNKTQVPCIESLCTIVGTEALNVTCSFVETEIQPGSQVSQKIMLECKMPFAEPPEIKISFVWNADMHFIDLKVPVFMTSFGTPVEFSDQAFSEKWKDLGEHSQESSTSATMGKENINDIVSFLDALHFSTNVAPDSSLVTGASTLQTSTINPSTGAPAVVGCLVQVALVQGSCSASVRGVNKTAMQSVMKAIKATFR